MHRHPPRGLTSPPAPSPTGPAIDAVPAGPRPVAHPPADGHERPVDDRAPRRLAFGPATIGDGAPVFVVAEIGINHNGCLERARRLIDLAAEAGADCVKLQMRSLGALYANGGDPDDPREDLGSQYVLDLLDRSALPPAALYELFDRAAARGVVPLCTPWDRPSLDALLAYDLPGLKVASADLTHHDLLAAMAASGKPLLVSTGMSDEGEIRQAVDLLRRLGARFALLHCVSAYPPPFKDLHLRYLRRLALLGGGCPVGYSGHERGWAAVLAAVALGAKVIEKHFTLDRALPGVDHKVSLLPDEFARMVEQIRQVEAALGSPGERRIGHGEAINRHTLAKSLVARRPVAAGERVTPAMVAVASPGRGLQPNRLDELLGRRLRRPVAPGEPFYPSDLNGGRARPRAWRFRRPWGVPVRFHDADELLRAARPDFVEFHLSYKDLEVDPARFLAGSYPSGFTVHSPDQLGDDLVLDLAADDPAGRRRSIAELQRVVDLARRLVPRFERTRRPLVVASLGGFSFDQTRSAAERPRLYDRLAESLDRLDLDGVELVPQTLPAFPWHFGGQRHAQLFVHPADTLDFCRRRGLRLCLDVAHTAMAARQAGAEPVEWIEALAPRAGHLHLCDAAGVDGEGLAIGEGEIDFADLAERLDRLAPGAGFVPEIWQGHWNGGEGFWRALDRLEEWFGEPSEPSSRRVAADDDGRPAAADAGHPPET